MKTKMTFKIKDFKIGEQYEHENITYTIKEVGRDYVDCQYGVLIKRFRKVLYGGVYVTLGRLNEVCFKSDIIQPIDDPTCEIRKYKRKK